MLTDEQIKALRDSCKWASPESNIWTSSDWDEEGRCDPDTIRELCTRVLASEARAKALEEALTKARASLDGVIGLYGLKTFTGSVVAWDEQPLHVRKVMEAELEARKALEPSLSPEDKPA